MVGISPMPSSKKARQAMMHLVETAGAGTESGPIVDLGSGWGSLIIRLAVKYPSRQVVGYELSIMPWFVAMLVSKLLGLKNLTVYRQDFLKADLSAASVIVCYLFPAGMAALDAKLAEQKTTIRYLISNNFALPSLSAEKTLNLDDFYQSPIYCYRING
ncbi:MAG: 16S rRNA A1518/A1519 N6-dimethyltransferase RsmA/KsgA/DIM1 with predicted DNA glycosylase [Pseudohongiellaceae bacterium]|jgi:16S rRNA A1518/A1519 N6-dimethyltransferase RsmA/KsgA/DIM1 with predicted DNA glycosylase/AP lyase activity